MDPDTKSNNFWDNVKIVLVGFWNLYQPTLRRKWMYFYIESQLKQAYWGVFEEKKLYINTMLPTRCFCIEMSVCWYKCSQVIISCHHFIDIKISCLCYTITNEIEISSSSFMLYTCLRSVKGGHTTPPFFLVPDHTK
jgi:hypothetical protein